MTGKVTGLGMDWNSPKHKRPIGSTTVADGNILAYLIKESDSWDEVIDRLYFPSTEQKYIIDRYRELGTEYSWIKDHIRV